jgi:hypothetical protein
MARTARTTCTAAPDINNPNDAPTDDPKEMDTNEETDDDPNDPDPESDPEEEPEVSPRTMKRELIRDYYKTVIGLNKTASLALYVDQNMTTKNNFLRIKPENIKKICTAIMKSTKTFILVLAMERLALLVYYIKHQERMSRNSKDLTEITSDDLDGLAHHMEVELNWDKKNKTPDPTPVTLDETSAHKAFSNMWLLLADMRGHNDVPLTYVIRPRILPPD